jgi:hypothetical protein
MCITNAVWDIIISFWIPFIWTPCILLSTLFSQTLNPSFNVRDKISHPYKTTGKIIVFYTSIFTFFKEQNAVFHNISQFQLLSCDHFFTSVLID